MNFLTSVVQAAIMLWMIASSVLTGGPWWTQAFLWILAVCCGLQFTLALMYLLWREAMVSVALCEKGILLNALYFHSWESLAGCRWDFARGYLWLTKRQYVLNGYVLPAEQRAEANRIMHEHVAAQGSSTAKTA